MLPPSKLHNVRFLEFHFDKIELMFKGLDFYYVTSIWIVNFLRKWNYCILSINYRRSAELSKNAKIWLSKSIFYVIKDLNISLKDIEQYHFISIFFFIDIFNFRTLAFIKRCPIFYNSTLCPIVNQLEYWYDTNGPFWSCMP